MSNFIIHSNNNFRMKIKLSNDGYPNNSNKIINNNKLDFSNTIRTYDHKTFLSKHNFNNKSKPIQLDKYHQNNSNNNSDIVNNNTLNSTSHLFPRIKAESSSTINIKSFPIQKFTFKQERTPQNKYLTLDRCKSSDKDNNSFKSILINIEKSHSLRKKNSAYNQGNKIQHKKINLFPTQTNQQLVFMKQQTSNRINNNNNQNDKIESIFKKVKPHIKINLSIPDYKNINSNTIHHNPFHPSSNKAKEIINNNNNIQNNNFLTNRVKSSLSSVSVLYKKNIPTSDPSMKYDESTSSSRITLAEFIIGKEIGKGAYASVRLCICRQNQKTYAVKIYENFLDNQSNTKRSAVHKEIEILKVLNHPNLIKLHYNFIEQSSLYLIIELAKGISLSMFLKTRTQHKLEEPKAKKVIYQLLSALKYLHSIGICHRDIKLENIITTQYLDIKLIDFGFATKLKFPLERLKLFCGTPNYMAPEILKKMEYIGPPTDIWSAGIIMYYLLNGAFPFKGKNQNELSQKILNGVFNIQKDISGNAHHLLSMMLCVNPEKRITAEKAMKHAWFCREVKKTEMNLNQA